MPELRDKRAEADKTDAGEHAPADETEDPPPEDDVPVKPTTTTRRPRPTTKRPKGSTKASPAAVNKGGATARKQPHRNGTLASRHHSSTTSSSSTTDASPDDDDDNNVTSLPGDMGIGGSGLPRSTLVPGKKVAGKNNGEKAYEAGMKTLSDAGGKRENVSNRCGVM